MDKCPRDISMYRRSVDTVIAVIVVVAANAAVLYVVDLHKKLIYVTYFTYEPIRFQNFV